MATDIDDPDRGKAPHRRGTSVRSNAPASASELSELLGELGPVTLEKLLATHATSQEVADALSALEDEDSCGAVPATAREAQVRSILEELMLESLEEQERDVART